MKFLEPVVMACAAPFGVGGLGRHLQELADCCKGARVFSGALTPRWTALLNRMPPMRYSPAWQGYIEAIAFDRQVARSLPRAKTFIGFNGQSLHSLRRARTLGYESVLLAAATPHVNLTVAQLRKAFAYAPVEPMGYIRAQHSRYLAEYRLASRILCATEYVQESFEREGMAREKLARFDLSPNPRFQPAGRPKSPGSFRIVYVGSLNIIKGIPVLLDAFAKLDHPGAQLTLVGGSGSRAMRRYLEARCAEDARIRIAPGDPLPHLQEADVCVHPAFQDGFAYAPMEALACGVPVVVTDHTGMKEYVRPGENGSIIPAGDPDAIRSALEKFAIKS